MDCKLTSVPSDASANTSVLYDIVVTAHKMSDAECVMHNVHDRFKNQLPSFLWNNGNAIEQNHLWLNQIVYSIVCVWICFKIKFGSMFAFVEMA